MNDKEIYCFLLYQLYIYIYKIGYPSTVREKSEVDGRCAHNIINCSQACIYSAIYTVYILGSGIMVFWVPYARKVMGQTVTMIILQRPQELQVLLLQRSSSDCLAQRPQGSPCPGFGFPHMAFKKYMFQIACCIRHYHCLALHSPCIWPLVVADVSLESVD